MPSDREKGTYSRIEQATGHSVENPGSGCEAEAKGERNKEETIQACLVRGNYIVGNLSSSKGEEQKPTWGSIQYPQRGSLGVSL